jgi:hypothetical protein
MNWESVSFFVTGVIVPIGVSLIKSKIENRKTKKEDKLTREIKVSGLVNHKLEDIKNKFHADRVWVLQFHNGGHYYPTGKSIQKFSMFYENVANGVDSVKTIFQNIPVSLFSPSINKVLEDNILSVVDFKDEKEQTYGLKHTAKETGCKSVYIAGIRDINNKLIGSLGIEYTKRKKALDLEQIQELELEATQIGGVLHSYLCEN